MLPICLITALIIDTTSAQTFEVASVKPSKSSTGRFVMTGGPGTSDPTRITYTNIMLRRVLLEAYDYRNYQIKGPNSLDSARFDIAATLPAGTSKVQFQTMLQNLLTTRFQMTTHVETKEMPVYALLVGKNGIKLKPTTAEPATDDLAVVQRQEAKDGFPVVSLPPGALVIETKNGRARVTAKDIPLAKLADFLTGQLGRPVLDKTGLAGTYTLAVYFTPENSTTGEASDPYLPTALQEQLGLRVEARKENVELFVIDHAEKIPTEN